MGNAELRRRKSLWAVCSSRRNSAQNADESRKKPHLRKTYQAGFERQLKLARGVIVDHFFRNAGNGRGVGAREAVDLIGIDGAIGVPKAVVRPSNG